MSNTSDQPYANYMNVRYEPLELVDVPALVAACTDQWYNQTLSKVNESVVRLGVMQGNITGTNMITTTNSFSL